jgi:hypothetical protein
MIGHYAQLVGAILNRAHHEHSPDSLALNGKIRRLARAGAMLG